MTPETQARQWIDARLQAAGWLIQDMKQLNLGAGPGIAVREHPTDTGPADYVLFVHRQPVGVIEAKKDSAGENLTATEAQTERYASANLKWRKDSTPLRFLFEATGQIIRFTDGADPAPRSREIFHFFKPETLAAWLAQPDTLRRRLAEQMPALPEQNLRHCQISAVTGLEKSLALNKPRALVHMATGAGKTFTAITSVYRLLKFGGAKRILFLVDTRNLGKQAHQEFMAYTPPDDGRKFTELYNVLRLPTGIFYAQGVKANVVFFDNAPKDGRVHTKGVWFYDLRTNKHFTLKTRTLKLDDLQDFIACYHPENRHERIATDRFKFFSYEELMARDKASLDIFWLKDDSLDNLDDLPPPDVLQQEIIDHLEAALAAFRDVAVGLPRSQASHLSLSS